jgi:hypothetical protein
MLVIGFLIILLLIEISIVFYSWRYGISPMPSSVKAKDKILTVIPQTLAGNIFELGAGWGLLAFPLARQFPHCSVYAYEVSFIPWCVAKFIQYFIKSDNLLILRQDFFHVSFKEASLIVCYLYPGAMQKLKVKFEKELAPGTFIVSNTFAIPGWTPDHIYKLDDLYQTSIYIYKV